jgi:glycosyltransferase involved in cell wall biosynthesis
MGNCLSHVDLILAPSRFTAGRHQEWLAAHDIQVPLEVVPEYVPAPVDPAPLPQGLPPRYFLYVGRLARAKGILDLAAVFARRRELPLVVVGRGEEETTLRGLGLPNVHLMGWVPRQELGGYYAGATGLVFPSLCAETFGLAAAEALSYGAPVVARRAGGVTDVVDGKVGFLYDTAAELEAALDRLWTGPDVRRRMSARARERYLNNYTPEVYLRNYLGAISRARR